MAKLVSEETGHIRATASCLQERVGGPELGRLYQSTAPPFSSHVTRQITELFLVFSPEPGAVAGAYGIEHCVRSIDSTLGARVNHSSCYY